MKSDAVQVPARDATERGVAAQARRLIKNLLPVATLILTGQVIQGFSQLDPRRRLRLDLDGNA